MNSRQSPPKFDRSLYLVICDHEDGPYIPKTTLADTGLVPVIKAVRDGRYSDIRAIIKCDPASHHCRDATRDFSAVLDEQETQHEK